MVTFSYPKSQANLIPELFCKEYKKDQLILKRIQKPIYSRFYLCKHMHSFFLDLDTNACRRLFRSKKKSHNALCSSNNLTFK